MDSSSRRTWSNALFPVFLLGFLDFQYLKREYGLKLVGDTRLATTAGLLMAARMHVYVLHIGRITLRKASCSPDASECKQTRQPSRRTWLLQQPYSAKKATAFRINLYTQMKHSRASKQHKNRKSRTASQTIRPRSSRSFTCTCERD